MAPQQGVLCWVEIPAKDMDKVYEFYKSAFPEWKFKETMTETDGQAKKMYQITFDPSSQNMLGGGIIQLPEQYKVEVQPMGAGLVPYFWSNNIEESVAKMEKLGAKLSLPKMDQNGMGWFCNLDDPEGNRFGLYQLSSKGQAEGTKTES
ncbi:hypothetical protein BT63DRAFT_460112 [Microthyrium microscopicum]|uniref:VOC domain-containing protein n=1 Tax=Microthyrium microscopicum TaxID=703497 RepID=A0A6A6TX32_9PEZI|nr:hypothetical protein BT63DRAFT_460112 [Microthyrium microscopicum]